MPPTTAYSFGDVVLVTFPFTDLSGLKNLGQLQFADIRPRHASLGPILG